MVARLGIFGVFNFFLQKGKQIRMIQHFCHFRDQKNDYIGNLHVIN